MEPIISIIVPIYNVEKYLDKCVQSIIEQTYTNLQIILVDDGSVDSCAQICNKYAQIDERILVIHKENGGLVSARKAGINVAVGTYVGYVDGDDWIEPDMIENLFKQITEVDADLVESCYYKQMGEKNILVESRLPFGVYEKEDIISQMLCDDNFNECNLTPFVWSKLFKKDLLQSVQNNVNENISIGEDAAVTYPYVLKCKKIVVSDYVGYHYVQRNNSMLKERKSNVLDKDIVLLKYLSEVFSKSTYSEILLKQLEQYAKTVVLLRNIAYFDDENSSEILLPFGGINKNDKVVIYGAGNLGQSVYHYLKKYKNICICGWVDKEYEKYKTGTVLAPHEINKYSDCKIIIAVINNKAVNAIYEFLLENNIKKNNIYRITDSFIKEENILSKLFRKIYIFGANSRAKSLQGYLEICKPQVDVEAFIVDDLVGNDTQIKGIPVTVFSQEMNLNKSFPVYIATKGVYHADIEARLKAYGMTKIIPVSVEADNRLRNECVQKIFASQNKLFIKITDLKAEKLLLKGVRNETKDINNRFFNNKIYVVKSFFDKPVETLYKMPEYEEIIYAGADFAKEHINIDYLVDNKGDNISHKNKQYCELTALYWLWKHAKEDVIGIVHYRRHFILEDNWFQIMQSNEIDVILPVPSFVFPSIEKNYKERHEAKDWEYLIEYLSENYIEMAEFAKKVYENNMYFPCNMLIAKKEVLNELCSWLFPILDAVAVHGGEKSDAYQNRYVGFVSERLITLFFLYYENKYKISYADRIFLR